MSTDLGLDPSDPLNLLLHNSAQDGNSSNDDSISSDSSATQDWSKFSSLWTDGSEQLGSMKSYNDMMDFPDLSALPMDMDFNPSMSIEPNTLHYDALKFSLGGLHYGYDDPIQTMPTEMLPGQYPFTFQPSLNNTSEYSLSASASPQSFVKERRLSVTSSSSSSGASLSPVPESLPSPAPGYASDNIQPKDEPSPEANHYINDLVAELAQRVRESAGVMMAVPSSSQLTNSTTSDQGKLPIPRLPRHNASPTSKSSNSSTSSSAASTPPPTTPPSSSGSSFKLTVNSHVPSGGSSGASTPTTSVPSGPQPRPKTSHTTIERRYRTNLNARIQSLRMAVPALRVLEDRDGGNGKKIKKNLKGGVIMKGTGIGIVDNEDGTIVDVIDERGFVDGVKVARKCSKANVLGKAVEYIRVLKRREQRLKEEQAGLKALVSGLVGGAALVREWEKEWRVKFGGEEKDEVEGDDEADDDDSDEDDGEDDDEVGRKRKRAKVPASNKKASEKDKKKSTNSLPPVNLLTTEQQAANPVPEKRKRGRPRKVLPPAVTLVPVAGATLSHHDHPGNDAVMQDGTRQTPVAFSQQAQWAQQQQQQQPHQQPQQYLLAVFALFSFFNSPLSPFSSSSPHSAHSHTGTVLNTPPLAYAPDIVAQFAAPPSPSLPATWAWKEYVQVFHLFVSCLVLASFVGSYLGLGFGMKASQFIPRGRSFSVQRSRSRNGRSPSGEKTDWIKVAQECIVDGTASSLTFYERFNIYRAVTSKRNASTQDLTALALVLWETTGPFKTIARMKATAVWARAQDYAKRAHPKYPVKTSEQLVLSTLSLSDAICRLSSLSSQDKSDAEQEFYAPIAALGSILVKERVKRHLGALFVQTVAIHDDEVTVTEKEVGEEEEAEVEWRMTVEAARELGGEAEELGRLFEKVWKTKSCVLDEEDIFGEDEMGEGEPSSESGPSVGGEIKALFIALVLYRRLFDDVRADVSASTLLSPPPSPGPRDGEKKGHMLLALRRALGSRVFEDAEDVKGAFGLEDARDRVVDMVVDSERRERGASP